jgi:hypothetical protein
VVQNAKTKAFVFFVPLWFKTAKTKAILSSLWFKS